MEISNDKMVSQWADDAVEVQQILEDGSEIAIVLDFSEVEKIVEFVKQMEIG